MTVRDREFRLRPVGSVADILRVTPGLLVVQHAGGGKANQYFLRGFDADHGTDIGLSIDVGAATGEVRAAARLCLRVDRVAILIDLVAWIDGLGERRTANQRQILGEIHLVVHALHLIIRIPVIVHLRGDAGEKTGDEPGA
jgi:hypothetical protein